MHLLQVDPGEHRVQVFYTAPTESMIPFQFGQSGEDAAEDQPSDETPE
jgi:hypothetical protein